MDTTAVQGVGLGIFFNAFVSVVVSLTALALVVFIFHRWSKLDGIMKSYSIFWSTVAVIWMCAFIRYVLVATGVPLLSILPLDYFIQGTIFSSGIILFYYLGLRITSRTPVAIFWALVSGLLAAVSLVFVFRSEGIVYPGITYFAADAELNVVSFGIFAFEVFVAACLLAYDLMTRLKRWRHKLVSETLSNALYSFGLFLYISLAGLDNMKVINDWSLVVFRIFYCGVILFVYIVVVSEEENKEQFIISAALEQKSL
ncbi:MAG: hypothetical protein WC817_02590 [Patescibacteria group bacterium]|jgi:hypothetical protein